MPARSGVPVFKKPMRLKALGVAHRNVHVKHQGTWTGSRVANLLCDGPDGKKSETLQAIRPQLCHCGVAAARERV